MIILGINAYHGDAAACLLKEGDLIAACEEERFSRIKHCAGFPGRAIQACLKAGGISIDEVDAVSISRNPEANVSKKVFYTIRNRSKLRNLIPSRLQNAAKIVRLRNVLAQALNVEGLNALKIYRVEHHLAHIASCFYPSPFDQAALLSVDGFGDFVSTKWGFGEGARIKILGQIEFPHSLGIFYTALTQYLGFPNYGDEYKVMGLAAYGKARYRSEFREIIRADPKKGFYLNLDFFNHHSDGIEMNWEDGSPTLSRCFSEHLIKKLGPARQPEQMITDRHRDLAASLQETFEDIYFHLMNQLYQQTRLKNLCLAGGCAFNSVANGKIRERTPFEHIFIQPAAGDAGTALGSALYVQHAVLHKPRRFSMRHAFWGPEFDAEEIEKGLADDDLPYLKLTDREIIRKTAHDLASGKIVGWFQGRMEYGPRALGHRSLLADPRRKEMKEILNERVKHREEFRPFAPSILVEEAGHFFEDVDSEPFMTRVFRVKKEKRELIPAVTHVDGTGRVQTVERETNPMYWALIHEFKALTGIPVLLNTSFNENEPIVCTPEDAIRCFKKTGMDSLVLGHFWLEKKAQTKSDQKEEDSNVILAK